MNNTCYIKSVSQISNQQPLCDNWFINPIIYTAEFTKAVSPDYKQIISSSESRRMSELLKRAIATSVTTTNKAGVLLPDAIITGTAMGLMKNSEDFLVDLLHNQETLCKPTLFMQSTHNSLSSAIAIKLNCHGYNMTYSHGEISFESALLDSWLKIKSGQCTNILTGSHDEATERISQYLINTRNDWKFLSEASVSTMLSTESTSAICELAAIHILRTNSDKKILSLLKTLDIDTLVIGTNGNPANDNLYKNIITIPTVNICIYKHIFGDSINASAIGYYTGTTILSQKTIPHFLLLKTRDELISPNSLAVVNHTQNYWTCIHLRRKMNVFNQK